MCTLFMNIFFTNLGGIDGTGVSNKGAVIFLNRGTSEQATSQDDLYKFFGSYSFFLDLVPNGKGFSKSGRVLNKIPGRGSGLGRVGVSKFMIGYFWVSFLLLSISGCVGYFRVSLFLW